MQISSGLRNHLMTTGSFKSALDGAYLKIYSGTPPTSADDAIPSGSTLLCTVTVDAGATGLTFVPSANAGLLLKDGAETWIGTNVADGTATWFRLAPAADAGDLSTSAIRVQGSVDYAGADLNITDPMLLTGASQTVDYFAVMMPA